MELAKLDVDFRKSILDSFNGATTTILIRITNFYQHNKREQFFEFIGWKKKKIPFDMKQSRLVKEN